MTLLAAFLLLCTFFSAEAKEEEELSLMKQDEDLIILGTLDGKVRGLSKETGSELWVIDTGGPMLAANRATAITLIPSLFLQLCSAGLQLQCCGHFVIRHVSFSMRCISSSMHEA